MPRTRKLTLLACLALGLAAGPAAATGEPANLVRPLERSLPLSPAALEARRVQVDTGLLEAGADRLRIELPDGLAYTAVRDGLERRGAADLLWTGRLDGVEGYSRVVVSQRGPLVHATVLAPEGTYELTPAPDGGHSFERLDPDALPACGGALEPPRGHRVESRDSGAASGRADARSARGANAGRGETVDVLGLYTPTARDALGGRAGIEAHFQAEIDKTNTALADSRMRMRFRLVHTALERRETTRPLRTELEAIRDSARVARLRNEHGADLVALMAGFGGRGATCGLAYVMREPEPDFERWAFSVTAVRCNNTLAHELGHNLGFEHDPDNSGATPDQASYPWSFGHFVDGRYRTLMAYADNCRMACPTALFFSNPGVSHQGEATGVAGERDNARTGDLTAPVVAAFRDSVAGLFADGFDQGNTDAWDDATGDLEVVEPGLRGSSHALRLTLDGTAAKSFVESRDPKKEKTLDVAFHLRPDRVALGGAEVTLLQLWNKSAPHLELRLGKSGGKYRVEVYARDAQGTLVSLGGAKVRANKADRVLIEWRRATTVGSADGSVRLSVNGRLRVEATGLDNRPWVVTRVRLGLPEGSAGAPAGGTFRLDGYASGR